MMAVDLEELSIDYTYCLDTFHGLIGPPVLSQRVADLKRADKTDPQITSLIMYLTG